uniref:C-type lectin domain-containing protein n=1 Tax=Angiostrongylus cantonensis TaxID=6313 RepID=A0A0K0D2Z9_ANGCA
MRYAFDFINHHLEMIEWISGLYNDSRWPADNVLTHDLNYRLFKLHLNPNCDTEEVFWTSLKMSSYWGRYIDCDKSETFCDDRADEITACHRPSTYHVFWRNGIDRYE